MTSIKRVAGFGSVFPRSLLGDDRPCFACAHLIAAVFRCTCLAYRSVIWSVPVGGLHISFYLEPCGPPPPPPPLLLNCCCAVCLAFRAFSTVKSHLMWEPMERQSLSWWAGIECGLSQNLSFWNCKSSFWEWDTSCFMLIHYSSTNNSCSQEMSHKIEPNEYRIKMEKIFRQQLSVRNSLNEK